MKEKQWLVLIPILVCTVLFVLFLYQWHTQQQATLAVQETSQKLKHVQQQNHLLKQQLDHKQASPTKQATTDQKTPAVSESQKEQDETKEFKSVATTVFNGLYTYDPTTYKERATTVSPHFSDELTQRYFKQNKNVGDAHGTTCKVTDLACYSGGDKQGNNLTGAVVVTYDVRQGQGDTLKNRDIYQVTYQPNTKKIVALKLITSGISVTDDD